MEGAIKVYKSVLSRTGIDLESGLIRIKDKFD